MATQFDTVEELQHFKHAAQVLLSNDALLQSLMDFCCFLDTTIDETPDALNMARREGRRQVFLWLVKNANLDVNDLMAAYKRKISNGR